MTYPSRIASISRIADDMWNRGDISVADEIMRANAKYHGPHMPNGLGSREDWKSAVQMYRAAFPDSHVTYEDLLEAKDTVIGRWSATATHTRDMPGLPATGKSIKISGITIYRFADEKIAEAWKELDMLGMWQQLGVVNLPGRH